MCVKKAAKIIFQATGKNTGKNNFKIYKALK